jgi:hypothetical protein
MPFRRARPFRARDSRVDGSTSRFAPRPFAVPTRTSGRPAVQRDVVDDADRSKVLLDRFNRLTERVQVIAAQIYTTAYRANPNGVLSFDPLFDAIETVVGSEAIRNAIDDEQQVIPISEIATRVTALSHAGWLSAAETTVAQERRMPSHQQMAGSPPFLAHYNLFDTNMIWRFTSRPSTEQVYIAGGTDYGEIARVVAAHSGGNDKSNPNVKTLSFGRNPGALMGVAASTGGDKHVLNIIDKAEYLYGIDIGTLADKGITAHAANARMISLFESEYVLLSTPGFPSQNLDQLATAKLKNPFKGHAIQEMLTSREQVGMEPVIKEMGTVEPERVENAQDMSLDFAQRILANAKRVKAAANPLAGAVQDKEQLDFGVAASALTQFTRNLR